MRGDSIRDFYAKGLALVGLGLIAGVGAFVDHWPGLEGPSAPLAPMLIDDVPAPAETARPLAIRVPDMSPSTVPLTQLAAATPRADVPAARRTVSKQAPVPTHAAGVVALVPRSHLRIGAELVTPPPRPVLTPSPVASAPATPLALSTPLVDDAPLRFAAATDQSDDNGDWFLTGAFKKTGASIVKGGVKTGASIADAARAVGSAFKHVWIFR